MQIAALYDFVSASRCLNPKSVLAAPVLRLVDVSPSQYMICLSTNWPMFSCGPSQVSAAWLCYLNWPLILLNSTSPGNASSGLRTTLGMWECLATCQSCWSCRLGERWSLHQCGARWWWHRSYPSSYYSGIASHPSLLPHDRQVLGWLTPDQTCVHNADVVSCFVWYNP